MGIEAKQESKSTNEIGKLMLKASSSSTTTTSRQWSGFKNPRIVRVSRRFGGKDRHSKVCTIRGLRDRRIRLSVPTAIQLYDLQHRLGLGQPSKVIDWLLDATTNDIDQLPPLDHIPQGFGTTHFPLHHQQQQQQQQFLFPHHQFHDDDDSNSLKGKGKVEDQILENINNEDHHQLFTQSFFPIGYNNGMTTYNYYHSDPCSNLSLYPPLPQIKDSHEAYCSSSRSSLPFGSHPQLLFYPSMATSTSTTLPLFSAPYVNGATQLENDEYPRQFNQFQFLNPPTNSSQEVPHHSLLPSSNPYFQKERYNENK